MSLAAQPITIVGRDFLVVLRGKLELEFNLQSLMFYDIEDSKHRLNNEVSWVEFVEMTVCFCRMTGSKMENKNFM